MTIADGVNFSAQLQVSILPNTYHVCVKTGANADTPSSSQFGTVLASPNLALGQRILLRSGNYVQGFIQRLTTPTGTWTGSNWVVIESEVPGDPNAAWNNKWPRANPKPMGGGAKFPGLVISGNGVSATPFYMQLYNISSNNDNLAKVDPATISASGIAFENGANTVQVFNCYCTSKIGADPATFAANGYPGNGIYMSGSGPWLIQDCEMYNHSYSILSAATGAGCSIIGCVCHHFYFRAPQIGDWSSFTYNWNYLYDHQYDPQQALHGDFLQLINQGLSGTLSGLTMIGNVHARGVGMTLAGNLYSDGIGLQQEDDANTVTYTGSVIKGNTYVGCFAQGLVFDNMQGTICRFNTNVMDMDSVQLPTVGNPPGTPQSLPSTIFLYGTTTVNADYNSICQPIIIPNPGPTILSQVGNVNTNNTPAGYLAAYAAPVFGSALETLDGVISAFSMLPGGTLDKATTGQPYNAGALGTGYIDIINRTTNFPI
jgi:hypothetical protein